MKIKYQDHRFSERTLKLLETANAIIEDYEAQG